MKTLGPAGKALWRELSEQYNVGGCAPLLGQLCAVADRLSEVRQTIASKPTLDPRLLAIELRLRDQYTKIWRALGLSDLPPQEVRKPGRPTEVERIRRA